MLIAIMLYIIGMAINPGAIYWVVFGTFVFIKLIELLCNVYKLGKNDK